MPMRLGMLLLLGLLACKSVQKTYRQASNEELEGKQAPPISCGKWLAAGAESRRSGEAEFRAAEWRVVAFFLPQ